MKKYISQLVLILVCIITYQTSSKANIDDTAKVNKDSVYTMTDNYVQKMMDSLEIIGLNYAILIDGKVVHKKALGFANIEHQVSMNTDKLFAVASISKLFSSTALHQLLQVQNRSVDETVADFLPNREDLPETWRKLSLKHLLSHTSGIPDQIDYNIFLAPESEEFVINGLKDKPFTSESGATSRYNATGFLLIRMIIEKLAGEDFETYMQKNIFDKFNLKSATYGGFKKVVPNRVKSYRMVGKNLEMFPLNYSSSMYAGAGLNINLDDLTQWVQVVLDGKIISKEKLNNIWKPFQLNNGKVGYFGLGWEAYELDNKIKINGHGGAGISSILHYRKEGFPNAITVILLTNGAKNWEQMPHDINMGIANYLMPEITD